VQSTIYGHLAAAIELGKLAEPARFFTATQEKEIAAAFHQVSNGKLVDVNALLGSRYDIGLLRIFRAFAVRERIER
jgi:helix-turn-helix protein